MEKPLTKKKLKKEIDKLRVHLLSYKLSTDHIAGPFEGMEDLEAKLKLLEEQLKQMED